jgi:hypothetical protein
MESEQKPPHATPSTETQPNPSPTEEPHPEEPAPKDAEATPPQDAPPAQSTQAATAPDAPGTARAPQAPKKPMDRFKKRGPSQKFTLGANDFFKQYMEDNNMDVAKIEKNVDKANNMGRN